MPISHTEIPTKHEPWGWIKAWCRFSDWGGKDVFLLFVLMPFYKINPQKAHEWEADIRSFLLIPYTNTFVLRSHWDNSAAQSHCKIVFFVLLHNIWTISPGHLTKSSKFKAYGTPGLKGVNCHEWLIVWLSQQYSNGKFLHVDRIAAMKIVWWAATFVRGTMEYCMDG